MPAGAASLGLNCLIYVDSVPVGWLVCPDMAAEGGYNLKVGSRSRSINVRSEHADWGHSSSATGAGSVAVGVG